jgi:UDP-glucose 4-epimerase
MEIAVTGADSFIGKYLITRLLKEGFDVYGHYFSKTPGDQLPVDRRWIGNLLNFDDVEAWVKFVQADIVIHLAAKTEVALSFDNYLEVSQVNYVGTVNLAEANRKYNPNLKLFMQASTMETYGHHQPEEGAFTEETEQRPMAPYAVAKLACEYYLKYLAYAYNFPFCAFRQTNAYGRWDNDFFVVEQFITQMLKNPREVNFGEPDAWRNFIFIDDLIDLYITVINNVDKARGEFFVTGPDNALLMQDLASIIAKKLNWTGEINWYTKPRRPGEVFYLNSNPAKAKRILGWEPKTTLAEGLDKTIEIWKKNLNGEAKS